MKKLILLGIIFLYSLSLLAKQSYTVSGIITEQSSGEVLIGSSVFIPEYSTGAISNSYGFYSITLPEGPCTLEFSYMGYQSFSKKIDLSSNMRFNVSLLPESVVMNDIVVRSQSTNHAIKSVRMNNQQLPVKTILNMPALMGEADVLKSLQLLPGVQSGGDGNSNLFVRGGTYDQNLILLDDAPIYNPSHALGFFSVFNSDAIKNVEIYKGGMPAKYGGRLSSVVDIRTRDGHKNEYHGIVSLGTIASRATIEGPIVKDKGSFLFSGRYSYAGAVANLFANFSDDFGTNNDVSFYDLNLKANYNISENDHVFFTSYVGRDDFFFEVIDSKSRMNWGNISSSLRWNHIFNDKLFSNTTLVFSNYDYSYYLLDDMRNYEWSADMQEYDIKSDFDYSINSNNSLSFGASFDFHTINPGKIEPRSSQSITKPYKLNKNFSAEPSIYLSHQCTVYDRLKFEYGFRYSLFFNYGDEDVNLYTDSSRDVLQSKKHYNFGTIHDLNHALEPRLNMSYQLLENQSIKFSYARTHQYMHLLSSSNLGLPTDVWYPVNRYFKPQQSDQLSLGYFFNFNDNNYQTSIEGYYKDMKNQLDIKDNAELFLNESIEQQVLSGDAWAYGAEFLIKKTNGPLTGWFSYTWSKVEKKIPGINNGEVYPSRQDKRHDLSLYLNYQLSKQWSVNSNFVYSTGSPVTIAKGGFDFDGTVLNYYTKRNSYRLPDYHRLDLSVKWIGKQKKYTQSEWNISLYNVYNRHNTFSIMSKQDDYDMQSSTYNKVYLMGIVPSISYVIKF